MKESIVVLNSGGFDSVVLIHEVVNNHPDTNIISLFFRYGQNNLVNEEKCSKNVSEKLGCKHIVIDLPEFTWTKSNFFGEDFKDSASQYLEYRNLIFLSYALSIAESVKATSIYMAILKSHCGYTDTSADFCETFNILSSNCSGIEFMTPYKELDKYDLMYEAHRLGVGISEFSSCDTPINGEPCNTCNDCRVIRDINDYLTINTPIKSWNSHFDPDNEEFQRLIKESPIHEMRVLHNNLCQLKCSHCFYGFEDTLSPVLPKEEIYEVILKGIDLGITHFHFSGKEPLFDEDIFWYADQLKWHDNVTFDVVTNGINVPKYIDQLKECGFKKVFLSVDEVLDTSGVRSVKGVYDKALNALNNAGIDVEVFIDLHENNYDKIKGIIEHLNKEYGVTNFYVRTINLIGNAKDMSPLSITQIEEVALQLNDLDTRNINVQFTLGVNHVYEILNSIGEEPILYELLITEMIINCIEYNNELYKVGLKVHPELYCGKYEHQITLTPDGYILGCGSEVSSKNYDKLSAGNIRDLPLKEIISRGKDICTKANCSKCNEGCLIFDNCPDLF